MDGCHRTTACASFEVCAEMQRLLGPFAACWHGWVARLGAAVAPALLAVKPVGVACGYSDGRPFLDQICV